MQNDKRQPVTAGASRADATDGSTLAEKAARPDQAEVEAALARLVDAILPEPRRAARPRSECAPARRDALRRKGG